MSQYQHMLISLDLTEESDQLLEKAVGLARVFGAKISLIHVIEPLNFAYGGDIPMDLSDVQAQIQAQADARLRQLATSHGISDDGLHLLLGNPVNEIKQFAEDQGVDLIVAGTHGKKGLALLLGSTANGILHGVCCDVLAIKIKNQE